MACAGSLRLEVPRGLNALRLRMAADQTNAARLSWLLIPYQQAGEVWPVAPPSASTGWPCLKQARTFLVSRSI